MDEKTFAKELKKKINSINKLIPYPKSLKYNLLNNYAKDLQEEFTETSKIPSDFQIDSRVIAEKLIKSLEWPIKDASLKKRSFAYLIDVPFSLVFSIIAWIISTVIFLQFNPKLFQTRWPTHIALTLFILQVSTLLYGMVFYFILLEGLFSTTIGKALFGMVIIDTKGTKITWIQSLIRSLTKLFPLLLFFETFIGFYNIKESKRIMDSIANTRVIELSKKTVIDEYLLTVKNKIPNHKKNIEIPLKNLQNELEEINKSEGIQNPAEIYGPADDVAKNLILTNNLNVYRNSSFLRIIAYLIDLILSIFLGIFLMLFPMAFIMSLDPTYFMYITNVIKPIVYMLIVSIPLYTLIFYPIFLEGYYSRTIGKWIVGIWTIDDSGIKISWEQAVKRSLTKIIPLLLIIELFYLLKDKKDKNRPLDKIAHTKVVKFK